MAHLGEMIGDGYEIRDLLGAGGTSRVYLVRKVDDGGLYAVKEISVLQAEKAGALAELRVAEHFFHPTLVHIRKVWEERENIYILMDYVEGKGLDELLRQKGAMSPEQAVDIAMQLCRALIYLHGFKPPLVYRDMKPANIILQKDGRVKLVDFGAVRQMHSGPGRDTRPLGTMGYAAPEQYRKYRQSDARTDIYGLGVTLYQMLTGHDPGEPPYRICRIREWNPALSPKLEHIVRKCTAKHPAARYHDCEKLLKALEGYRERDRRSFLSRFSAMADRVFT